MIGSFSPSELASLLKTERTLIEAADWYLWMSEAHWPEVAALQRPLTDGALKIVGQGGRQDVGGA